jgi:hypothetical protein
VQVLTHTTATALLSDPSGRTGILSKFYKLFSPKSPKLMITRIIISFLMIVMKEKEL